MRDTSTEVLVKVADYAVDASGTIATIGLGSCVAIVLHDYEGLDHLEVAKMTGIEHAAARKRYSRGLEKLAKKLKDVLR